MFYPSLVDVANLPGYIRTSILRRSAGAMTTTNTIVVPPPPQFGNNTAAAITPFPQAYMRAKAYLKTMLKEKLQLLKHEDGPDLSHLAISRYSSQKAVVEKFHEQLLNYTCGEYPFLENTYDPGSGGPLEWWKGLENHPKADILAVSHTLPVLNI